MDLHLNLLQDSIIKAVFEGVTTVNKSTFSSWAYLEGMYYQLDLCSHKFTIDSRSLLIAKVIWNVLLWRILRSLQAKTVHFPVCLSEAFYSECRRFYTWPIVWGTVLMKMIFSAIRMNNPTVRNIMLHILYKDTTSETPILLYGISFSSLSDITEVREVYIKPCMMIFFGQTVTTWNMPRC